MLRSTDLVGRVVGGRYRLLRAIGSGASAHVYVAEDVRLRRRIAIKVLHPALAEDRAFTLRFQAEAQTVAALRHPSILRVYDWGEDQGEAYLVMELLEGGSLRAMLDTGARLSVSQGAAMGVDVASALAYAHSRGLVHRDIKPANLLFDEEGHVSVADFGIARALAEASWTEPWGAMLGTARYAAPEQLRAVALDGRADVYALAMVLVEAVTGTVPFALDTTLGALMARADQPIPVPAELGPLAPVLSQAGTPEPADRLSAEALAQAIARAATTLRAPAPLALAGLRPSEVNLSDRTELGPVRRPPPKGLTVLADELPPQVLATPSEAPTVPPVDLATGPAVVAPVLALAPAPVGPAPLAPAPLGPAPLGPANGPLTGPTTAFEQPPALPPARPRRTRRFRRWLVAVALVVVLALLGGGGAVAYVELTKPPPPPPRFAVPSLSGDNVSQARLALRGRHLALSVIGSQWDSAKKGTVISQTPTVGARLLAGQRVVVTLSRGPQPVAVPDLATMDLAQAKVALADSQLSLGSVAHHTSMSVPAGIVISWSHQGQHLLPGRKVNLVLSAGKPMAVVPPISPATATWDLMAAELTKLGLEPVEITTYSVTVPAGDVISAYPAPGDQEVVGSEVRVTVSLGPHMAVIPDVVGMSPDEAAKALENAGLYSTGVQGNPLANVTSTDPPVSTAVRYGTGVLLIT